MAIHEGEAERQEFIQLIRDAPDVTMSAATYVECALVLDRRPSIRGESHIDSLLASLGVDVVAFTPEHARVARQAHQRFGRGSGHPARLNLGDCFSYALAIGEDEPLLFKGDDFTHTDVRNAALG